MSREPLIRTVIKTLEAAEANWAGTNAGGRIGYMADALESARLLQSPETAAEHEELRAKFADAAATVAQLVQERGDRMKVEHAVRDEAEALRARVAELEADLVAKAQDAEAAVKGWGRARERVTELEELLVATDRPVDEDPIAYALTDKAEAAAESIVRPCGCPRRFDRHAWGCPTTAAEHDVTPQVTKLRALLAGQREQAQGGGI
ncbi:hypothetical protein AB0A91_16215 [Streptomyces sp. NPDC042207]|uniref:hypothetical protein n=1 Tax=Streptomyces sp. NPDC042207 TaxID=3154331 RepID=UPI0033E921DA